MGGHSEVMVVLYDRSATYSWIRVFKMIRFCLQGYFDSTNHIMGLSFFKLISMFKTEELEFGQRFLSTSFD